MRGKIGLALASTLVLFVVAEVVLRLAGFGRLEVYDTDAELFWRLRPGQVCRTKVGGHPVHVNDQGYRGLPIAATDPDGEAAQVFAHIAQVIDVELAPKRIYHPELRLN